MDETTNIQNQVPVPVVTAQSDSEVVNFLVNKGIVNTESSAKVIISIFCVALIAASMYFVFRDDSSLELPAGSRIIEIPGQPPRLETPVAR